MNMLRRSVGRAVRSRIVPYVALYAVLLALHLQFTLGTGDDPMYAAMLDQYSLAYFSLWHYYTWSARTLIEAVVCIVEALPAIVWRLADPLCITLCAACIVRLARLEDRPAGRWAVCGLALCYPWQDMSSAGWVCTTLVFVWPLAAALTAASASISRTCSAAASAAAGADLAAAGEKRPKQCRKAEAGSAPQGSLARRLKARLPKGRAGPEKKSCNPSSARRRNDRRAFLLCPVPIL